MTTKRRPSHINLSAANAAAAKEAASLLAPRTPKSISKSRRSSIVQEPGATATANNSSRPSSRRSSLANIYDSNNNSNGQLTPSLLSESTTTGGGYFNQEFRQSADSSEMERQQLHQNPGYQQQQPLQKQQQQQQQRESDAAAIAAAVAAAADAAAEAMAALPPNFDVHMSYKIKTTKSSKKLNKFFGEQAPHDICVREIRNEGLKALLQSKIPLCYFLYHLLEEFSCENLFFFIELEQYASFTYVSHVQQLATAQHIHNTYLTRNSHFEVNLDDKVRRQATAALEDQRVEGLFDNAKRAVYSLLESSFMRFCQTDTFTKMVMNCGELTTHYDTPTRHNAVRQLLSYIEKQHAMIYTSAPVLANISQSSRRRHELVKSMIAEFCRTILGVEVEAVTVTTSGGNNNNDNQSTSTSIKASKGLFGKRK